MVGVPNNFIVPFVGIDIDSSFASQGGAVMPFKALMIGQKTASGTLSQGVLQQVFSIADVIGYAGNASMLHAMARRWFAQTQYTETYIITLDDAVGTQATVDLTITGTSATEDGQLVIEINGDRIATAVAVGDTPTDVAAAIDARMADFDYLPWTSSPTAGVVTFTATNDGVAAGDGDFRLGDNPTDKVPAGLSASFGAITPGTVDPDIQDAIDAIGDVKFNVIANPYNDDTNLDALETYLETQYGAMYMRDGLCYQAMRGTVSELTTFSTGGNRNCQHAVLIDAGNRRCSTYELAAAYAGIAAREMEADPGSPLHRVTLQGIRVNASSERRSAAERNTLALAGVATLTDEVGVQTDSTVTMYLKNSAGATDTSYRYQNTLYILGYTRWDWVNTLNTKYARARLAQSAEGFRANIKVITPVSAKMETISWFLKHREGGLFQGSESDFANGVVAYIPEDNPNRLEIQVSPDLVNQLITVSGIIAFL